MRFVFPARALLALAALAAGCDGTAYADATRGATSASTGGATNASRSFSLCAPTVASVTASSGTESGSTSVTVSGTCFTGATSATFGGAAGTSLSVTNATTLTVSTPSLITVGQTLSSTATDNDVTVAVTGPGGTGSLSAGYRYTSEFKRIAGSLYSNEYRANNARNTITSGACATLADYNANGDETQGTANLRPAYNATGWNGGPVCTSDGADDFLLATFGTPISSGTRPYVLMAIKRVAGTSGRMCSLIDATGANFLTIDYAASHWQAIRTENSSSNTSDDGNYDTGAHLLEVGFTASGTSTLVVDGSGTNNTKTGTPNANITRLALHASAIGTVPANSSLVFALVLNDAPTAQNLTDLRAAAKSAIWRSYTSNLLGLP